MGKLGYSSITLTDLTETIPVNLILETNQNSNIQTKIGNLFTPDFSKKDENNNFVEELIITPSLFLGNEEIKLKEHPEYVDPNGRTSGFIYYQIGKVDENGKEINYYYNASNAGSIYVDILGCLHIRENLSNNITIEAYIDNFHNAAHNYTIPLVQATNPINFLLLEDNGDVFSVVIKTNGRQHFEETKATPIILTATLYQGAEPFSNENELSYRWYKITDGIDNNWTNKELEVSRNMVYSEEKFLCEITMSSTGITYSGIIDIWDQTENYDCTIVSNRQLLLSENFEDLILTANVYDKKGTLVESKDEPQENGYYLTYQWGIAGNGDGQDIDGATSKTLEITNASTFLPKSQSFVIYCKVFNTSITGLNGEETITQITSENEIIQFIPEYDVKITPRSIFVPVSNDGEYQGAETYSFIFQLLDKEGNLIDYDLETSAINKNITDEDGTQINFEGPIEGKWNFKGTITLSVEQGTWWKEPTIGSKSYSFTYVYREQQFSEQIEIIKNKAGNIGEDGTGYTIHLSNESVSLPGDVLKAIPEVNKEIEISAYKNVKQIPTKVTAINDIAVEGDGEISGIGGFQISILGNDSIGTQINFKTTDNLESDGQISINIEVDGKTFRKYWSYSISKTGAQGASGNTYQLIIQPSILVYKVKDGIGQFLDSSNNPATITTNAVKYQGTDMTSSSYEGIIEFYGATSNSNWTLLKTNDPKLENYKNPDSSWSDTAGLLQYRNFKFILYDTEKKRVLDEQTLPVIKDGYYSGGRNLILNSDITLNATETRQEGFLSITSSIDYESYFGQDLTLSFDRMLAANRTIIDSSAGNNFGFYLQIEYLWKETLDETSVTTTTEKYFFTEQASDLLTPEDGLNDKRYSATINFVKPIQTGYTLIKITNIKLYYDLNYSGNSTDKNYYIERPQLEFGDSASTWTAAPEDVSFANLQGINLVPNGFSFIVPQSAEDIIDETKAKYDFEISEKGDYTISWASFETNFDVSLKVLNADGSVKKTSEILNKGKFSATFENLEKEQTIQILVTKTGSSTEEVKATFSKFKIEKGSTPTPWIASDTDIETILSQVNSQISNSNFLTADEVISVIDSSGNYINIESDEWKNLKTAVCTLVGDNLATPETEAFTNYKTFYNSTTTDGKVYIQEIQSAINLAYDESNSPYLQLSTKAGNSGTYCMRLTTNKLGFYDSTNANAEPLAYFSSSKLYITTAIVKTNLVIGDKDIGGIIFTPTSTGVGLTRVKEGSSIFS